MTQPYYSILLLITGLSFPAAPIVSPQQGSKPALRVPRTRSLKFAVTEVTTRDASTSASAGLSILTGGEDELPDGPTSFDILPDGSLAITDPIQHRIVFYDPSGAFKRAWSIGFAADRVTIARDNLLVIRNQKTGEIGLFDKEGKMQSASHVQAPELPQASLQPGTNRGVLSFSTPAGTLARKVSVVYDQPRSTLVSIQPIAVDPNLGTFVALETTDAESTSDSIDVHELVRRYSPSGEFISETAWLPLDYYVPPLDELRVHNGVLYQLETTRTEVYINQWDLNSK